MSADERAARDAWSKSDTRSAPRAGTLDRLAWHLRQDQISWRRVSTCTDEQAVGFLAGCRAYGTVRAELARIGAKN